MASAELTYTVEVWDNNSDNEVVGDYLNLLFNCFEAINELVAFGLETRTSSRIGYGQVEERPPLRSTRSIRPPMYKKIKIPKIEALDLRAQENMPVYVWNWPKPPKVSFYANDT